MNYYYDVILNWNENPFKFYEWMDTDYLELVKKIPLIKVRHKTITDLLTYQIKVNSEFLTTIKDKTLISGKNIVNRIEYAALFTDNKSVIAIEFNSEGKSINMSYLLLDDELSILEASYNLKEYLLDYTLSTPIKENTNLRQINEAKKVITLEINNLYQNKDISKLKYLYYEYKKEKLDDIGEIYNNIMQDLQDNFIPEFLKLYYIIKLSYHNV